MFEISTEAQAVRDAVQSFYLEKILPNHHRWLAEAEQYEEPPIEAELRTEAKTLGLWNLALPRLATMNPGHGCLTLSLQPSRKS